MVEGAASGTPLPIQKRNLMSKAIDNLKKAMDQAAAIRPKAGGFPFLAECLRRAGVSHNIWSLPACQSLFLTDQGPVVMQGGPLVSGLADVPPFDQEALIKALRVDQAGDSTFPEFSRVTSPTSRLCKAISAAIERPMIR